MIKEEMIKSVGSYFQNKKIDLPEIPALYAFWWIGEKEELMSSHRNIILSGPGKKPLEVELNDWWPKSLSLPCLYVGKTTNLKKRFAQHVKNGSPKRLHKIKKNGKKIKAVTTSCQLRYGIEHIFRDAKKPLKIIHNKVGFSFKTEFEGVPLVERFYGEDLQIGQWRPWFNLDSER